MKLENLNHAELWHKLRQTKATYNFLSEKERRGIRGKKLEEDLKEIRERIQVLDKGV